MTGRKLSARARAAQLIDQALDTGVRGEIRDHLVRAQKAAAGQRTTGLTRIDYENLPPGARLHDADRPGLVMRHGRRTGRVWIFRHTDPLTGRRVETHFGTFPSLSVAEARARWGELRDAVNRGEAATPAAIGAPLTMAGLVDRYLEEYARPTKRSWQADEAALRRHVLSHYADVPAATFGSDRVRAILAPIAERAPREAEKVRGVLSSMFNVAIRGSRKIGNLAGETWLPPDMPNPVSAVILPARATKSHAPGEAELARLIAGAAGMDDAGDALLLQAQTCARVSEVAALPWAEIDMVAGTWLLPAPRAKNGHPHLVMLPRQSVALLERRRSGPAGNSPFVFPAPRDRTRSFTRNTVQKAIGRNREALGLAPGFVSHSLRHACLTWLAENGAGREVRDRVSNHVDGASIDAVYNRATLNRPAREWLQRWADHLDALGAQAST